MEEPVTGQCIGKSSRSCEICRAENNLKRCTKCKCVYYCSREHQKQDWVNHKKSCFPPCTENTSEVKNESEQNSIVPEQNEEQKEIESILNFDSFKREIVIEDKPQSKEIFSDLKNSKDDDYNYMGPSDYAFISGGEDVLLDAAEDQNQQPDLIHKESNNKPLEVYSEADTLKQEILENDGEDDDFIHFDPRPLRKLKFPLPESYNHKDLAEFISLRLISLGYCVVDNIFSEEDIDGLTSEIKSLDASNELKPGQLGGGKTSVEDDKKSTRTDIRSDKMKWIQGDEEEMVYAGKVISVLDSIMQFAGSYLKVKDYGNIEGRSKAMLTCYPGNGAFYRRHIDNGNKDGRRITCILYLNKDWDVETDGGLLRILPPSQDKQIDIPPKANRLLYFWSDKRNPHEVHPAYRERYAMTVWYFDSDERTAAKLKGIQAETDSINERITELEEKKKEMEEVTKAQIIQNKAMDAVRALSEQELQAISVMVHTHPRPRQVLTAMGISSHIQEALIQHLSNL